jgi:hypothetical protein
MQTPYHYRQIVVEEKLACFWLVVVAHLVFVWFLPILAPLRRNYLAAAPVAASYRSVQLASLPYEFEGRQFLACQFLAPWLFFLYHPIIQVVHVKISYARTPKSDSLLTFDALEVICSPCEIRTYNTHWSLLKFCQARRSPNRLCLHVKLSHKAGKVIVFEMLG